MSRYDFTKKRVILTGASSGIGRELSLLLCDKYECDVIGIARSEERLLQTRTLLKSPERFTYRLFDVSDEKSWDVFAGEPDLECDVLINCAGMLPRFDKFERFTPELIRKTVDTDFYSCLWSYKSLLPVLRRSKDSYIINVASSAALAAIPGTAVYSASKSAVKSFTEAVREELHGEVRVSLVCPGFSLTNIFRDQKSAADNRLIGFVSTPPEKVARRVMRALSRGKRLVVTGADAHMMSIFTRLFGSFSFPIYRIVMKSAKTELFRDIFRK